MKKSLLTFLFGALVIACGGGTNGAPSESDEGDERDEAAARPGAFAVSRMDGLARAESAAAASYDLGDLPITKTYYFMLSNTGGAAITNISLTSDNPAFVVSPSHIDVLNPAGSAASVLPIVSVQVRHGQGDVGFAPVLAKGVNSAKVSLSGTSAAANVTLAFDLRVDSLLADFRITSGSMSYDACMATSKIGAVLAAPTSAPVIENTGNVALTVTFDQNGPDAPQASALLQPGDTLTVTPKVGWSVPVRMSSSPVAVSRLRENQLPNGETSFSFSPASGCAAQ